MDSGFVNRTPAGPPVQLGDGGSIASVPTLIFLFALVLIGVLVARRVPGAILIGIVVSTILAIIAQAMLQLGASADSPGGWHMTIPELPSAILTIPDFGLVGQFDLFGAFGRVGVLSATMLVFTLVFTNFFDAMGSMTGLAKNAGLAHKDGTFPRLRSAFIVEGFGAIAGGGTSSSSATVSVDSAAGIGEGARTGLASVTVGVLFLLSMFFTPLTLTVPIEVGSAALVVVGAMMMAQIKEIKFTKFSRGAAGLPHDRDDAADLLDRQWHRHRLRLVGAHQCALRSCSQGALAAVGGQPPASRCTSYADRSRRCSPADSALRAPGPPRGAGRACFPGPVVPGDVAAGVREGKRGWERAGSRGKPSRTGCPHPDSGCQHPDAVIRMPGHEAAAAEPRSRMKG